MISSDPAVAIGLICQLTDPVHSVTDLDYWHTDRLACVWSDWLFVDQQSDVIGQRTCERSDWLFVDQQSDVIGQHTCERSDWLFVDQQSDVIGQRACERSWDVSDDKTSSVDSSLGREDKYWLIHSGYESPSPAQPSLAYESFIQSV